MSRKPSNMAEKMDEMSLGEKKPQKQSKSDSMADKMDSMSYQAPDPREKSNSLINLRSQEEVAAFVSDMGIFLGQGAAHGYGDEMLAGIQTGSLSSPEYVTKRDNLRAKLDEKREKHPIMSPVMEGVGGMASSSLLPIARTLPVATEIASSALQATGESLEKEDMGSDALYGGAISAGIQGTGKIIKATAFDDPTKILARSTGVGSSDLKGNPNARIIKSIKKLDGAGFFKQGEVTFPVDHVSGAITPKFKRSATSLTGLFQPQTLKSLEERTLKHLDILKKRNEKLLRGKKVSGRLLKNRLFDGIVEITFEPNGFNAEKRYELANELESVFFNDLKIKTGWMPGQDISAADVETAKRALDKYIGGAAFEKKAIETGVDKQAMLTFREKLDEILDTDKIGGPEYKQNNDLMSALLDVQDVIKSKASRDYVDTGSGTVVDMRDWKTRMLESFSPTSVDIARADTAKVLDSKWGMRASELARRIPGESHFQRQTPNNYVEELPPQEQQTQSPSQGYDFSNTKPAFKNQYNPVDRKYQSVGNTDMTPMQIAKAKLPRTTEGLLQNKELVIAKMTLNGVPDEMIQEIVHALNEDPEAVESIAPMIALQFPALFEKSKYKMFDGRLLDPNERAKAADGISKRDDMGSIQKAKIIDELNKNGKWLGE